MKRDDEMDDNYRDWQRLMNLKGILSILNVLVFLISLGCFGICLWIRFDLDFREWVREMDWYELHFTEIL